MYCADRTILNAIAEVNYGRTILVRTAQTEMEIANSLKFVCQRNDQRAAT